MQEWVNLIVNNGIAVVVCAYFLWTNYKFNDTLTRTLTEVEMTLKDIQEDIKESRGNAKK